MIRSAEVILRFKALISPLLSKLLIVSCWLSARIDPRLVSLFELMVIVGAMISEGGISKVLAMDWIFCVDLRSIEFPAASLVTGKQIGRAHV